MSRIYINPKLSATLAHHSMGVQQYMPAYGGESACLDLYNCGPEIIIPSLTKQNTPLKSSLQDFEKQRLKTLIPTGLHLALQPSTVGLIKERGSITKTPLVLRAGVIDPGYTGEVFVNMVNVSNNDYVIPKHAKLPVQLLITIALTKFDRTLSLEEYNSWTTSSQRREGQRGSSD